MIRISLESTVKQVAAPKTYQEFTSKLLQLFPQLVSAKFALSYKDEDDDQIAVDEQSSYETMLGENEGGSLQCNIEVISTQEETSQNGSQFCSQRQSDDGNNPTFREQGGEFQEEEQSVNNQSLQEKKHDQPHGDNEFNDSRSNDDAVGKQSQLIESNRGLEDNEKNDGNRSLPSEEQINHDQQNYSYASEQISKVNQGPKNEPVKSETPSGLPENLKSSELARVKKGHIYPQGANIIFENERKNYEQSHPQELHVSPPENQERRRYINQQISQSTQKVLRVKEEEQQYVQITKRQYESMREQLILLQSLQRQLRQVTSSSKGSCTFCEIGIRKYRVNPFKRVFLCEDCHNCIDIRVTARHQMIV